MAKSPRPRRTKRKPPKKRPRKRKPLSTVTKKRIKSVETAKRIIKPKRPSFVTIGQTKFHDIRSFKRLFKTIANLRQYSPTGRYTYSLVFRYVDVDGKKKEVPLHPHVALPFPKKSKRLRSRRIKGKRKRVKLPIKDAFHRAVYNRIRGRIFRYIEEVFGAYRSIKEVAGKGKLAISQVRKNLLRRKRLEYSVIFHREFLK